MKKIFILSIFLTGLSYSHAQELFLVKLKAKENTSNYLSNPLQMLSQKAIDRRSRYSISINEEDVPISTNRINQVKNLDLNYIGHSKWLNTIMVEITNQTVINSLKSLNFVESVETMVRNSSPKTNEQHLSKWNFFNESYNLSAKYTYGRSDEFINQINLKPLHNNNILGQNISIAVIDAGFPNVNQLAAFNLLRQENRIVDTYDFVDKTKNVYKASEHGTMVLSTIAGEIDGTYVGTAPKANFSLYRSEEDAETPKELLYWIKAAERADSVGVDVINTSLGYSTFDDARYDYTFDDMDGKTTLISQGANVATQKGIFVVVASGNEGNIPWKRITAPSDVTSVFTIGANNSNRNPASFSSYGPNALGEIKPNVSALGSGIYVVYPEGSIGISQGTSFSSPVTAGAVALMIQQFPKVAHNVLKDNIQKTAHLYNNPSEQLGYGVPDYYKASQSLLSVNDLSKENKIKIYPNPFKEIINIQSREKVKSIELYNLVGQKLISSDDNLSISTIQLKAGAYLIKIIDVKGNIFTEKVLKY